MTQAMVDERLSMEAMEVVSAYDEWGSDGAMVYFGCCGLASSQCEGHQNLFLVLRHWMQAFEEQLDDVKMMERLPTLLYVFL